MRALFFEFPQEPELLSVDRQFMVGGDILVSPVLTPNVTSVSGGAPARCMRAHQTHLFVEQVSFPVADRSSGVTGTPTPL